MHATVIQPVVCAPKIKSHRNARRIYATTQNVSTFTSTPRVNTSTSSPHARPFALSPKLSNNKSASSRLTAHAQKQKFTSFDDVINQAPIVLVDWYATWCGPCLMQSNAMAEASQAMQGTPIKFIKIDTEKYPQLASRFNVSALPTLTLFKNGKLVGRQEGMLPASELQRWIQQAAR